MSLKREGVKSINLANDITPVAGACNQDNILSGFVTMWACLAYEPYAFQEGLCDPWR
jgi:hypothetical protein